MIHNTSNQLFQRFANWRTVVVFAAFFSALAVSCKKDNLLGIEVQPDGQFDTLQFIDSLSVKAYTLLGTRQRSDEAQSYVGRIESPLFGTTESALITNFQLETGNVGLFSGYSVDSIVLHLRPNKIYGVPQDKINVEVYELDKTIFIDSAYYSDFSPPTKRLVGSSVFSYARQIAINDTINIDGTREPFQFRVKLDSALGQYLLDGLSDESVNSTAQFQSFFKGLIIKPGGSISGTGAIYSLALLTGESGIRLYASDTAGAQSIIEYPISGECARVNQFNHDYSGSLTQSYLNSGSASNDLIFVQGLAGTKAEIQIPGLYNFGRDRLLAVSKATLTFEQSDQQPSNLSHSKQLFLLDLEKNGDETLTLDYLYSKARHGGKYDSSKKQYVFDITRHVQRVLEEAREGNDVNYGLRLHAQVPVLNGNDTANNVLKGLDNIVLKLYHTDLNN